jgi:prevent-host-death family protein
MTTVTMTEARAKWWELMRRAEGGEEITITKRGRPVAKFVPIGVNPKRDWDEIDRHVKEIQQQVKAKMQPDWPDAAHSQDWLYDERGLPK